MYGICTEVRVELCVFTEWVDLVKESDYLSTGVIKYSVYLISNFDGAFYNSVVLYKAMHTQFSVLLTL